MPPPVGVLRGADPPLDADPPTTSSDVVTLRSRLLAASVAATVAAVVTNPLDVIKTRIQTNHALLGSDAMKIGARAKRCPITIATACCVWPTTLMLTLVRTVWRPLLGITMTPAFCRWADCLGVIIAICQCSFVELGILGPLPTHGKTQRRNVYGGGAIRLRL